MTTQKITLCIILKFIVYSIDRYISPLLAFSSLSLSGFDRHDFISPCFSFLCELWFELVFIHFIPHSVHLPQSGPSSRSVPSHRHRCHSLFNVLVVYYHYMAMPRNAFLCDICCYWLDLCMYASVEIPDIHRQAMSKT